MQQVADTFLQSAAAVQSPSALSLGPALVQLVTKLEAAMPPEQLASAIHASFGANAADVVSSSKFAADRQRVSDTLLASSLASSPPSRPGPSLADIYRAIDLVRGVANGEQADARSMLRPLLLPAHLFPLPSTAERQAVPPAAQDSVAADARAALTKKAQDIAEAIRAVAEIPVTDTPVSPGTKQRAGGVKHVAGGMLKPNQQLLRADRARGLSTISAMTPRADQPSVLQQLSPAIHATVMQLGGHVANLPIAALHSELRAKFVQTITEIGDFPTVFPWWPPTAEPAQHDDALDKPPAVLTAPPSSHGTLKPAGVADLLVVRQHVLRYEPGEVAYVENIGAGEDFERRTKRTDASQTTVFVEQSTTTAQERDTQATSRFDLNHQASTVVQEDFARIPGSPTSQAYGPLVESGGSKTNANSTATNFGQSITSRAATNITQEARTETTTVTSKSFEEHVVHHLDNSTGTKNKSLVYQWLDKVAQAQVFSYGKRVLYDMNVPEPAAFLLRALAHEQPDVLTLQKPLPFTLQADGLDDVTYLYYAAAYGATGVQPPPERYRTVCMQWDGPPATDGAPVNITRSIPINVPNGYSATKAFATAYWVFWEGMGDPSLTAIVGHRFLELGGPTGISFQASPLNDEVGDIPLTLLVDGPVRDFTFTVEVLCTRTDELYGNWQLRTADAILQASRERITDYETKWAALRTALKMLTFGQGDARKRQLERSELQKAALTVLTNQHFDGLSAIEHSPQGYPQPFLPNVESVGRYVRFFEQAFEWDQMLYFYYPYFWGRKPYWIDRILLEDADDQFGDFLRAGSARVIVPVRKDFDVAVASFMASGTVPTTDELRQFTTGEHLPFLAELLGETGGPDTAKPYGDPWEVRLPTTLTVLRGDATLPRWKEQLDGDGRAVFVSDGKDAIG